jgi:hypothetical protein
LNDLSRSKAARVKNSTKNLLIKRGAMIMMYNMAYGYSMNLLIKRGAI